MAFKRLGHLEDVETCSNLFVARLGFFTEVDNIWLPLTVIPDILHKSSIVSASGSLTGRRESGFLFVRYCRLCLHSYLVGFFFFLDVGYYFCILMSSVSYRTRWNVYIVMGWNAQRDKTALNEPLSITAELHQLALGKRMYKMTRNLSFLCTLWKFPVKICTFRGLSQNYLLGGEGWVFQPQEIVKYTVPN